MTPSIAEKAIRDGLATLKKATAPWSTDVQTAFTKVDKAGKAVLAPNTKKTQTPSAPNVTDDLRHAFVPLYEHFTQDALQLAAAIFTICVKQRALPARSKGDMEGAERWEGVVASVIDGVLDYHEKDESSTTKLAISRAFYKNIALHFFASGSSSSAFSISLRQTVYTLLCYTSTHHPENQETLRKLVSPEKFGQVIYACKDSLPQDELLNTLGVVLPRVRKGPPENRARASQMLRECFDQPDMHPAGAEIARHVESKLEKTNEWSETVEEIGALLAREISFPQPFQHTLFQAGGLVDPPKRVQSRFFVDRHSFVFTNETEEEGTYDTFIVGFNTIAHMSVSKTGLVTGQLTTPPGGGPHGALARRPSGTVPLSLMFKVEVSRAEHLYNTLVDRNLKSVAWKDMTQGKTRKQFSISQEPARLDFVDGKNAYEPTTSEKARMVAEGVDKASEAGDEQPIGDELAFTAEVQVVRVPPAPSRAQHEPKQPRAKEPLPSLTERLTQITTPGSTPVPRPAPVPPPDVSPGPYIESPPSTSLSKPAPTRRPSFSSKFTDLLTKANSNASKPTSHASKPDSSKSSKVIAPASSKSRAPSKPAVSLPKTLSITSHEEFQNSSQERQAEIEGDMFGTSESLSELSDQESDDDSIPEAARIRARKAQERGQSVKGGRKSGMRVVDSNDGQPPASSSTRKRKAAEISENGGFQPERRTSPRLSQAAPVVKEVPPMVDEPASAMSPPRFPSLVAQDVAAPAPVKKKPPQRPKGKAAAASKVSEDASSTSAPAKKAANASKKAAETLADASDSSPPGASKKTPAQTKATVASTTAPAAPKKKAEPAPAPITSALAQPAEGRTRPTRASAAAASKKIAQDAGVLNQSTQSSSPSVAGHGSSSTAVEGHRARSAASASAEPEPAKPTATRETEVQESSTSPPAATSARGKRKREEEVQPTSDASVHLPKRRRSNPKTPAAPSGPKPKAPPARPTKPAARKYGTRGAAKEKDPNTSASEVNFDSIPGSSPKSPLEEMLAQTRGPRSSSPAPLTVAGPSKVGAMRGKGASAKEPAKTKGPVEEAIGKREIKRLPRRVAAQRAPHLSPTENSERTGDIDSVAPASTPPSHVPHASKTNAPRPGHASSKAPRSRGDAFDDITTLFDEQAGSATAERARAPGPVQRIAPEFDFGESSPEEGEAAPAPALNDEADVEPAAVEEVDVAEMFDDVQVSVQAPTAKRASLKDATMEGETLYDDVDMLDATINISPPRLSAAAKGKARLSSPVIIEAAAEAIDTFDVDFEFDGEAGIDPASDSAKEDPKVSDKSSSSESYREKYTDITLPLKGEKEDSAPPFDVYMSCEDVSLPSFDEEPEEHVAVRSKKSVAFAEAEAAPRQKPTPFAPRTQEQPIAAPRASTSSNRLSPIRVSHVEPQEERPRLFQAKAAKTASPAQPRRSGPPRRIPLKSRTPVIAEEKQQEQEPMDRVLEIMDEINTIVKVKIRTGFSGVDQRVINMRNRFLRQAADDIRAQLPEYIATYNELLELHEAYCAFAVRKQAAISHAEQLANEGVRQVKEIIRAHDLRAVEMARNRPVMPPLPKSVTKWLT
ncbi:unnamed protein product [Peniophora sp. CBMAI 1063]|nr:unnamed protein product [Peniophora sp. CBMAI 1063]